MVVDAMDLSYSKEHLDTFVIVSGDSDFSPLVSKLKENNKYVIGIGVKNSSSNLLIDNCDEFIYYEDLLRERRQRADQKPARAKTQRKAKGAEGTVAAKDSEGLKRRGARHRARDRRGLFRDRDSRLLGSHIKQTLKRKRPEFSETFHGYRSFNELLEDAQHRGLLQLQKDEPSGGYIVVGLDDEET